MFKHTTILATAMLLTASCSAETELPELMDDPDFDELEAILVDKTAPVTNPTNTTTPAKLNTIAECFNNNPVMFICGMVLMFFLIMVSNAGGLSGAGSNIPVMLIFFNMDMAQAVPVSAFVAVCATSLRFVMNYRQKHPQNAMRLSLNYDVVMLTMPSVFLGSMIGV